ncbi:hypothetical protein [Agromyces protaetiae]|uniref:hypothetical protein n=1 Tax=Agromyces protaetiae TaxID=2509455 RepID=UPI00269F2918
MGAVDHRLRARAHAHGSRPRGEWPVVAFSPRKASISLYGLHEPHLREHGVDELVAQLGKVKIGVGCLWVGRLSTIDLDVLASLVDRAWVHTRGAV